MNMRSMVTSVLAVTLLATVVVGCSGAPASADQTTTFAAEYLVAVATANSAELQSHIAMSDYQRYATEIGARELGNVEISTSSQVDAARVRYDYNVSPEGSTPSSGAVVAWREPDDPKGVVRGQIDDGEELLITVERRGDRYAIVEVSGDNPARFFGQWQRQD